MEKGGKGVRGAGEWLRVVTGGACKEGRRCCGVAVGFLDFFGFFCFCFGFFVWEPKEFKLNSIYRAK